MGRPRVGAVQWHGDHWDIRITLPSGKRTPWKCQPPGMSEARARDKAKYLTEEAERTKAVPVKNTKPGPTEAFSAYVIRWTADRQRRGLTTVDDDRGRLRRWVEPHLGTHQMGEITKEDLEGLIEKLDAHVIAGDLAWRTARNVWGVVSKLFDDAAASKTRALRVREHNPATGVRPPDTGEKKSKVYIYPSEFLTLVTCKDIPRTWRRIYAVATYLWGRAGELRALQWDDVDLVHGMIHVHASIDDEGETGTTKSQVARRIPIEVELLPLLKAMHEETGGKGPILPHVPVEKHMAPMLRRDLAKAGVKRAELFGTTATRKQLTFHDLRATGVTWAAVRGDEPLKIKARAGHKTFSTTEGYIREAESMAADFGTPFPLLPAELFRQEYRQSGSAETAMYT